MKISCTILNVSILIFTIYLESTANFAFVQLYFDAGEIVLPNLSYCIFTFSMYAHFLWQRSNFTADSIRATIIYATSIWIVGHLLLKHIWILLISCSGAIVRWIGNAFGQNYTIESGSKQQIWLTYVSLALAVAISNFLLSKKTVSNVVPDVVATESIPIHRRNKIVKYRIPK